VDLLDISLLSESELDIKLATDDRETHALFFTATWCDWYFKESHPEISKNCTAAQESVNSFSIQYPNIVWHGVASRLWTGDKDLSDYRKKYAITHPLEIDKSNRLFHQYLVKDLPTLILIKNNKAVLKITDFNDKEKITKLLDEH